MVVVPKDRVAEVEYLVHRRHPEAFGGGVWMVYGIAWDLMD